MNGTESGRRVPRLPGGYREWVEGTESGRRAPRLLGGHREWVEGMHRDCIGAGWMAPNHQTLPAPCMTRPMHQLFQAQHKEDVSWSALFESQVSVEQMRRIYVYGLSFIWRSG